LQRKIERQNEYGFLFSVSVFPFVRKAQFAADRAEL